MLTTPWSKYEVDLLRSIAKKGYPSSYAAAQLRRSHGATRFKAAKVGIRFSCLGRKHSQRQKARYK